MNKSMAERLFEDFKNKVADNLHLKNVIESSTNHHLEHLKGVDDANWLEGKLINESFLFSNLTEDKREKFAFRSSNKERLTEGIKQLQNHQFCWLLVSNYEALETYLDCIYCNLKGLKRDPKKINPLSRMLTYFSEKYPEVRKHDQAKIMNLELKVHLIFIEKLRHLIVHNFGKCENPDEILKEVVKSSGLPNNKKEKIEFMANFFDKNKVIMLDWLDKENTRLQITYKMLDNFSGCLVSYASLLKDQFE